VLSIPFVVPYFLGAVLLRGEAAERSLHIDYLAAGRTGAGVVREPQ
jgi:hypothetical protein